MKHLTSRVLDGASVVAVIGGAATIAYFLVDKPVDKYVESMPAPIVIDYEFERCSTLKQEPDFTYSVEEQTVSFVIECRPEIMLYFFKAEVPDEVDS